ncbi:MAG: hypothetical protein JWO19_1135 [Bryobacterales bacterium]|jgi:hypothetical protein|nr:hypothetical protein [Bryobacterales bacterium]
MRILPTLFAAALCMPAQELDRLPRIRERMTDVLLRQPNYTCTETIERTRQVAGNHARIEDTLRLEVALVDGKEMFAWPGSKQFEDRELGELVSTGMFGNGNFAIYARILFLSNVAAFEDRGRTDLGGRAALRYDFRVARASSGHRLRVNHREAVVGFHGSFYADPVTLDVRRVEVVADDIPAELGVSAAKTKIDYGRLRIGDEEFLLPVESELMMAMPDQVNRNWVRFTACRRFTGESTLSFSDPVLTEASAPAAVREVDIPAGLTLQLEMPELDLMQAAVGDPVRGILRADLRSRRELLAPKGSIARGRIVRLDRYSSYFALQIEFQDLDWPSGHARVKLSFDQAAVVTRVITRAQPGGELVISRQAGPRLSGILMFWRTEP